MSHNRLLLAVIESHVRLQIVKGRSVAIGAVLGVIVGAVLPLFI